MDTMIRPRVEYTMFKGMKDIMQKVTKRDRKKVDPVILPICTATTLLENPKRQETMHKFPELLSLSTEEYAKFCEPLIKNFAEFVQELPSTRHSYYSHKGGMLEHALNRASAALRLCRSYFLPDEGNTEKLTPAQTLWAYALFTAAMVYDIGRIVVDLKIDICDQQGRVDKVWVPFDGAMVGQGERYRYEFENFHPDAFRRRATVLLARQLLPAEGFHWIASNKEVLAIWLAILDDDERSGGILGTVLWRSDALTISEYFESLRTERDVAFGEAQSFAEIQSTFSAPDKGTLSERRQDSQAGVEFLKWIRGQIASGQMTIGQAPLLAVSGGILVSSDAFKLFVRENPDYKNWQAVQQWFTGMGLSSVGPANETSQRFLALQTDNKSEVSGIVIKNRYLLQQSTVNKAAQYASVQQNVVPKQQYIAPNGQIVNQTANPAAPLSATAAAEQTGPAELDGTRPSRR